MKSLGEEESTSKGTGNEPSNPLSSLFRESLALQEKGNLMRAPEAIYTRLHPHQMIALNWMFNREVCPGNSPFWVKEPGGYVSILTGECRRLSAPSDIRGGILADDMGLGKTLTLICLIMTNFYDGRPLAKPLYGYVRKPFDCLRNPKRPQNQTNLSINTPKPPPLREGPRKFINVFDFSQEEKPHVSEEPFYDSDEEDLPSPGWISKESSDHEVEEVDSPEMKKPRYSLPSCSNASVECEEIDADFSQRLIVPPKEPSKSLGESLATLIVCPLSLLHHWVSEFNKHLDRSVKIDLFMHYGEFKGKKCSLELERCHVVVTTYGTLSSEFRKDNASPESTPLLHARWLRVILDEGHLVRNEKAYVTQSVLALKAERKWVITGTPIQNRLKELYSLVNWLGVSPFKGDKRAWSALVGNGTSKEGMNRLRVLLTRICMRRLKNDRLNGKPLVDLPPRTFYERKVAFEGLDARLHAVLRDKGLKFIEKLLRRGELNKNFGLVFALIMRMRQYCCHPELVSIDLRKKLLTHLNDKNSQEESFLEGFGKELEPGLASELKEVLRETLSNEEDEANTSCPICLDELSPGSASITQCKHIFCIKCLKEFFSNFNSSSALCPLCRSSITPEKISLSLREEEDGPDVVIPDLDTSQDSPKLIAVLKELESIPPGDKVVIVSQFTSFLSIIAPHLSRKNYDWVRLDGTMSLRQRGEVLDTFSRGSPSILLLSLKAGGIGLNLIAGNHLFLLDPAWNPADEDQVFDRIYRMGQEKPVYIYKYIVEESIEERILELQRHKRNLAKALFDRNASISSLKDGRIKNFKVLVGLDF